MRDELCVSSLPCTVAFIVQFGDFAGAQVFWLGGMQEWRPGETVPALGGGKHGCRHSLNEAGLQVIGNLITNFDRLPREVLIRLVSVFA
jgi:hypothetical protein